MHPAGLELEAFACGEDRAAVETHVAACDACKTFVERVRRATAADGAPRLAAAKVRARRRTLGEIGAVASPLAMAAALLLVLRTGGLPRAVPEGSPAPTVTESPRAPSEPETTFKGHVQTAVIRERNQGQERFTGAVKVRPGDRLRIEVDLDRERTIIGAVLGEDGTYLELMPDRQRGPGMHFSEQAARVDSTPLSGTILVGSPEAVARARSTGRTTDVSTIRVEWEQPP